MWGQYETCTGTYTTTQADVDAGSVTNVATWEAGYNCCNVLVSNSSTVTVAASDATSSLSLTKSTTSNGYYAAGQTIPYDYLVTNTGTTTISNIAVADNKVNGEGGTVICPSTPLSPTVSETCTASYTTTQADVSAGSVTNIAMATGTNPSGVTVTSSTSSVTVPVVGADLSVEVTDNLTGSTFSPTTNDTTGGSAGRRRVDRLHGRG